jgi:hypothetical protein
MPAGSIDLTATNIYGDNYGNFAEMNALPGSEFWRSRLVETSAIKPYGASAGVGYKIMRIPSYTLIQKVMGVVVTSASAAVACSCGIGDADASTTWVSDCSITVLGPPQQDGVNVSWNLGVSLLGPSHLLVGKYYSNGGEIQIAFTASEAVARVWVTVQGINLKPV